MRADAIVRNFSARLVGMRDGSRLIVLMYHRVLSEPDPLLPDLPDAAVFESQMASLARFFRPCRLDEALDRLRDRDLPPASVCVTFDDGYADNHDVARPILERYGIPATIFVAPGFLDGGAMWNDAVIEAVRSVRAPALDLADIGLGRLPTGTWADKSRTIKAVLDQLKYQTPDERAVRVAALRRLCRAIAVPDLMMRSAQVRAMHRVGHTIGAHTMCHPILTRIDDADARRELVDSKAALESLIDAPVDLFAYPNGAPDRDYGLRHVAAAREAGFKAAVSVSWGAADCRTDRHQIPRIWPWDRTPARFALRLWRAYLGPSAPTASRW